MDSTDNKREENALEALICACLRLTTQTPDVSSDAIAAFLKEDIHLSPEDKSALNALGESIIHLIAHSDNPTTSNPHVILDSLESSCISFAMNRKSKSDHHEEEVQEELERKRNEILKQIRDQKSNSK